MGICNSRRSTSVAEPTAAKLVSLDGALREFTAPVKASHVLQKAEPTCFVCDSDEMEFDEFLVAVDADEELRPGQLYFALPLSWQARPLRGEDMAALAVKANLALKRSGGGGGEKNSKCGCCCNGRVDPFMFYDEKVTRVKSRRKVAVGGGGGGGGGGGPVEEKRLRRRGGVDGGKVNKLTRKLSMILED